MAAIMPRRLDPASESVTFRIVLPADLLRRIDDWRRGEPDLPTRSAAIRRLVDWAIAAQKKAKKKTVK